VPKSKSNTQTGPIDGETKEYDQIIGELFKRLYKPNETKLSFTKKHIEQVIRDLGLEIRNVPDIAYTYRTGRSPLPAEILKHGHWAIDGAGKGKYVLICQRTLRKHRFWTRLRKWCSSIRAMTSRLCYLASVITALWIRLSI